MLRRFVFFNRTDGRCILCRHDEGVWQDEAPPLLTGPLRRDFVFDGDPNRLPAERRRKTDTADASPTSPLRPQRPHEFKLDFRQDRVVVSYVAKNGDDPVCIMLIRTHDDLWVVAWVSVPNSEASVIRDDTVSLIGDEDELLDWLVEHDVLFDEMWPALLDSCPELGVVIQEAIQRGHLNENGQHPHHRSSPDNQHVADRSAASVIPDDAESQDLLDSVRRWMEIPSKNSGPTKDQYRFMKCVVESGGRANPADISTACEFDYENPREGCRKMVERVQKRLEAADQKWAILPEDRGEVVIVPAS